MKNIKNIIILSPILIYLILLLINNDILTSTQKVNIFWIFKPELPIIVLISIFFIIYIIILYFSEKFSMFFAWNKAKNLEQEILKLKASLQEQTPELVSEMKKEFKTIVEEIKTENKKSLDLSKKETDKILWNIEIEINNLKEKIEKNK